MPLRFREHQANAAKVADFLKGHKAVSSVIYPGLFGGAEKDLADTYLTKGHGALVGFELAGGVAAGRSLLTI